GRVGQTIDGDDRRVDRQGPDALRTVDGQPHGDDPTEAHAIEVEAVDAEEVEKGEDVFGPGARRYLSDVLAAAHAPQMRRDHPEVHRQIRDDPLEVAGRVHDAVEEDDRFAAA